MRTVTILLDSLNKHFLTCYKDRPFRLPAFERLAAKSHVFDNHWVGSLPCMPARRDLFTGRLEFLERGWGPLEPFDVTFIKQLKNKDVYTHMITDHYHYFESAGNHYCQQFDTFDFIRGQEFDQWQGDVEKDIKFYPTKEDYDNDPYSDGQRRYGIYSSQYEKNKAAFKEEFPVETVFGNACEWLRRNREQDDWFLMVETFDPHEPFDAPQRFKEMAGAIDDDVLYNWSAYNYTYEPENAVENLKNHYVANLLYADHCLGKMLDCFDELDIWDDTMIILTTDHGHMVGEHNFAGKNIMPLYNEIAAIPLFIHTPGQSEQTRRPQLTQVTDLFPTILDYYNVPYNEKRLHGSAIPLCDGCESDGVHSIRENLLFGVFGANVNITDGEYTYFRAHVNADNQPKYCYTAVPSTYRAPHNGDEEMFKTIECGRFLNYTNHPVFKVPSYAVFLNDRFMQFCGEDRLYNLKLDPCQENNLVGEDIEQIYIKMMKKEMQKLDAPQEQYVRLGL